MRMYVAGQWIDKGQTIAVENPYDRRVIDTVPRADRADVERAIESAVRGSRAMARLSGYERYHVLRKAADLMAARREDLGRTISLEEGKVLAEGRLEVDRAVETMLGSAEEAKRIHGETVPVDGSPGGAGRVAFTLRVPCGVVVAITPLQLPAQPGVPQGGSRAGRRQRRHREAGHRHAAVGPQADRDPAGGRAAAEGIQCLTGPGGEIGDLLAADPRVRKITFTGSRDVGERICRTAGIKKVTMELGSNAPVIVMPDADLDRVAEPRSRPPGSPTPARCASRPSGSWRPDGLRRLPGRAQAQGGGHHGRGPAGRATQDGSDGPREGRRAGRASGSSEAVGGGAPAGDRRRRQGRGPRATVVADVKPHHADLGRGAVRPGGGRHSVRRASTRRSPWPTTPTTAWRPASSPRTSSTP